MIRSPVLAIPVLATSVALLCSCQQAEPELASQTFADDGVSFAPPDGWRLRRDRDTLVMVEQATGAAGRSTIAVRSVPIERGGVVRTADNVLPSTETVLRALPGAQLSDPTKVEHPAYDGVAYDVTFVPQSRRGQTYQRRHVVLFAWSRVFHVLHTGPSGQLDRSRAAFEKVLASIREEG